MTDSALDVFEKQRPMLFGIACLGVLRRFPADLSTRPVLVNGQPACSSPRPASRSMSSCPGQDDRISAIRLIRNPDKLAHRATG